MCELMEIENEIVVDGYEIVVVSCFIGVGFDGFILIFMCIVV